MTKEKMQKAQELDGKISELDVDIKILEERLKTGINSIHLTICSEEGDEQHLTFLKGEFDTGIIFRDLLEMYREKRNRLNDEFLAL